MKMAGANQEKIRPGQVSVVAGAGGVSAILELPSAPPGSLAPEPPWWGERARRPHIQRRVNHKGSERRWLFTSTASINPRDSRPASPLQGRP